MMKKKDSGAPLVALQIEKNRAHGRELLRGIADYALENTDWRLELVEPAQLSRTSFVSRYDGLIVRVMDDATTDVLLKTGRPVVDTYGRTDGNPLESIRLDDRMISEMAAACFEERHYRSFAYCGFDGLRFSDMRGEMFSACASRLGVPCSVYHIPRSMRIADAFFRDEKTGTPDAAALGRWLRSLPKPVAIFCCNDLRALQVLHVCADIGLDVPSEAAVLGVDNDVLLCTFAKPSLSSIETGPFALGRKAAEMLDRQMRRPHGRRGRVMPPVLHAPTRIVERTSTNAYSFRTPWLADAVRYIRQNLTKGVTAADVVRHVGYSQPTVCRAFEEELGHSIKREILCRRIRLACDMLKHTGCSAGEVALRCGYRSPQYFSHCFMEEFGTTPDGWRKRPV